LSTDGSEGVSEALDSEAPEPPEAKRSESYRDAAARGYSFDPVAVPADYPIVEAFGYPPDAETAEAESARQRCWCPFMDQPCAKLISPAKTGICSIRYRAEGFGETNWAVCQHRLKGAPFREAVSRHFGSRARDASLVTELRLDKPRMSLDGVGAVVEGEEVKDLVGIEAQTIDTRGGSLKPLWESFVSGRPDRWRDGYPAGPKFGVNTTNVWKRLLPQVMNKGRLYRGWDSKLYVVVQDPVFQFIARRMPLERLPRQAAGQAEIVWLLWDFVEGGLRDPESGMLLAEVAEAVYTTIDQVEDAFVNIAFTPKNEFLKRLLKKLER
jgi:Restriction endonuclease NotI